jgi:oligopeptide transport system substrate-binding protein
MHSHARTIVAPQPMERRRRLTRRALTQACAGVAALAATAPLSVLAAQSEPESEAGGGPVLPLYPHGQRIVLDPHRATNWGPHWVLLPYVWSGLLGFDEHGAVIPVLASSVEPEEGGRVWVAEIRPEATFASGNPVTAEAMISGWLRALRPQRTAPMVSYMRRVEGFDAFIAGDSDQIGFEVRDDRTVGIRLAEPYALFREDLATFVWAAVDTVALDAIPESRAPFGDASAGTWRFIDPSNADDIVIARRDDDPTGPSSFHRVTFRPVEGPLSAETALEALLRDEVAVADVPQSMLSEVAGTDEADIEIRTIEPSGSTLLVGMDFRQSPFDDPRVRQAIALSIDRERWAREIMGGEFLPAQSITPPAIAALADYPAPAPLEYDPDTARSLVQEAGISADEMPTMSYFQAADAPQAEVEHAAMLLEMIEENSGLIIEHDRSLTMQQIAARRGDNRGLQFDIRWWWPRTSSPSALVDLGSPESPSMDGWFNWSATIDNDALSEGAEQFVDIVSRAQTTMDDTERTRLFAQAEQLLVDNVVYVPLGYWVQTFAQSSRLEGTRQGAFTGYLPIAFDDGVSWVADEEDAPAT